MALELGKVGVDESLIRKSQRLGDTGTPAAPATTNVQPDPPSKSEDSEFINRQDTFKQIPVETPILEKVSPDGDDVGSKILKVLRGNDFKVYLALFGVQLFYAIFHVASSAATKDGSNGYQIAMFRNGFGAVPLFFIGLYHSKWNIWELCAFTPKEWFAVFIYSMLLIPGLQLMIALSLKFVSADTSSILQLLVPIWTTGIAVVARKEHLVVLSIEGALKIGGMCLSIFGAVFMVGFANLGGGGNILAGIGLLVIGTVDMALFIVFSRETIHKHGGSKVVFWIAVIGASSVAIIGGFTENINSDAMQKVTYVSWLCYLATALFSAAGAELLLAYSIPRTSPVIVAIFYTALPFCAAILSLIVFGELWTVQMAIGAMFLITGLFCVCYAKYRDGENVKRAAEQKTQEPSL
jgi:drug/metabolite transporter (DMT)-like permease